MRNIMLALLLVVGGFGLTGCGSIESEHVGVRTTFTGEVKLQEEQQGFYTAVTSSVDEFSCKEITITLDDMRPKAGDNLTMQDLDIEIYYKVVCDQIAEQHLKYASGTARSVDGYYYAGYNLARSYGREAAYNAVTKFDSLQVHLNRDAIGVEIMEETQNALERDDPGIYQVTKVIIRNAETDSSVEESIRLAVRKDKELEAVTKQVQILEQQALANEQLQTSLTPEILTDKYLDVLAVGAANGSLKMIDLGCEADFMIQASDLK